MSLFGVGLDVEVKRINTNLKMQIIKKGGIGIHTLGVIFRQMDNNGNKKLDIEEFTRALNTFGIFPKIVEAQALMKFYDVDGDGNISFEEFLRGLREPLTARRSSMVNQAFGLMDKDGSGVICVKDIDAVFDVSCNQDFIDGQKTRQDVLEDFLNGFEGAKGNADGKISKAEWCDYYTDLSMSIPDEGYFAAMMESVWNICEDETATVSKNQITDLVKALRHKLLDFSKGNQDEYVLRAMFKEFDTNGSGTLTVNELGGMMARL
jgi:Ca2+-binding EF-hand superfamily protein